MLDDDWTPCWWSSDGATPLTHHRFRHDHARAVVARAAKQGWLGRLARAVGLEREIDRLYEDPEGVEGAIWRAHQAAKVAAASPITLELLAWEGLSPTEMASRLAARREWIDWLCGPRPVPWTPRGGGGAARVDVDPTRERLFLHGARAFRDPGDPLGALGFRFSSNGFEIGAGLFGGRVLLRTWEGEAILDVSIDFPATVRAAAVGRPVEEVFDHPALRGRGYVVEASEDLEAAVVEDPAWRLRFRAPPVPWRVPRHRASDEEADAGPRVVGRGAGGAS